MALEKNAPRQMVYMIIIGMSIFQFVICAANGFTEDNYIISMLAFACAGIFFGIVAWVVPSPFGEIPLVDGNNAKNPNGGETKTPLLWPIVFLIICLGQGILAILVLAIPDNTITEKWQKNSLLLMGVVVMFVSGLWLGVSLS